MHGERRTPERPPPAPWDPARDFAGRATRCRRGALTAVTTATSTGRKIPAPPSAGRGRKSRPASAGAFRNSWRQSGNRPCRQTAPAAPTSPLCPLPVRPASTPATRNSTQQGHQGIGWIRPSCGPPQRNGCQQHARPGEVARPRKPRGKNHTIYFRYKYRVWLRPSPSSAMFSTFPASSS